MGKTRNIFLDTNTIIYFLEGIKEFKIIGGYRSFFYSFITEIELLAFATDEKKQVIIDFLKRGKRISIDDKIIRQSIEVRRTVRLKIPDAIIIASAKSVGADFYTSDEEILRKVDFLNVINLLNK